jgi:hypothetical protein
LAHKVINCLLRLMPQGVVVENIVGMVEVVALA